jgi:hypothetical protein
MYKNIISDRLTEKRFVAIQYPVTNPRTQQFQVIPNTELVFNTVL